MTDEEHTSGGLGNPATLPAPASISEAAAQFLNYMASTPAAPELKAGPAEEWDRLAEQQNSLMAAQFAAFLPAEDTLSRHRGEQGGVPTTALVPSEVDCGRETPLFLEIHGGGLWLGGGEVSWMMACMAAAGRRGITWAPDYRMPPHHCYPAPLDDVLSVYRAALERTSPENIIVSGTSAGGNLAAALLVRARDEGLPMPAGLVLASPEVDLTESGDSFVTNHGIDPVLSSLMPVNRMYADGRSLDDPYLSPLLADLTGLPPTLLYTGTRDLYLSNTVRMHRALLAAGVPAELHVMEAMPHGAFTGVTPEDVELRQAVRAFERARLGQS